MNNDDLTYSMPVLCDKEVYNNGKIKITKKWTWDVEEINEDKETGILKARLKGLKGLSYKYNGISTFASIDGKRLTTQDFDYLSDSSDGLFLVGKNGKGYGFIDKDMNMVIEPQYDLAKNFINGMAKVHRDDEWFFVNKKGEELHLEKKYEEINYFSDGLARVATMKLDYADLAYDYDTDYCNNAGIYGYIDKTGKEVIKSQYIYAFDFYNDRAIVAKGKWAIDKKQGGYWPEKELWGVIDKNGKEIIPCAYDEICNLRDVNKKPVNDYYCVHVGGYQNGKWAIADRNGKFITEPIFGYIGCVYRDGLIYYTEEDFDEDGSYGIYDLKNNKILFTPQFENVVFSENGIIFVVIQDKESDKTYPKIIKKDGTEIVSKKYDRIIDFGTEFCGEINKGNGIIICELINQDGVVLESGKLEYPQKYYLKDRIYNYKKNGKTGIKDFDGKIIIPAKFDDIYFSDNKFYITENKKENKIEYELYDFDGNRIFEQEYRNIQMLNDNTIICKNKNSCEIYQIENF